MTSTMSDDTQRILHLFSYGTLQLATFGRRLAGRAGRLPAYRLDELAISDAALVATSGKTHHPIAVFTGRVEDAIDGMVLEVTPAELAHADDYEVADYRREAVKLASGATAWAYVDARNAAPR